MKSWKYYWKKNKLQIKMIFLAVLVIGFIVNLIVIGIQKSERKKAREENSVADETCVPDSGTQMLENLVPESEMETSESVVPESGTQVSEENVPDSGTSNCIRNLEEYATPVLQEQALALEYHLSLFLKEQSGAVTEAEIFHVMIPEDDPNLIKFFLRLQDSEERVEMTFDRISGAVNTNFCKYTEEEIVAEIWEGYEPECKDLEEE